ncbi:hypothetical protein GCM10027435_11540 [Haloparvum alkalitolerans]|uniref:type IV pilin n=1 Tax=Haloparvum alkalitolerans TaxID=1042953 RepID=UPI003CF0CC95
MLGDPDRLDSRASAPVGAALLVALAVVLAAGVGGATLGAGEALPAGDGPPAVALGIEAAGDRVTITHRGGEALDVRPLRLVVRVDGEPLDRQPPVPFFSAAGFRPGPTGAFNRAGTTTLRAGESAAFRVAGTNDPTPEPGATLTVRVFLRGTLVATLETRVAPG